MLYNFPHSMGSENLILSTFQKKAKQTNRAVGPEDFKRPQRGSIIDYKAEN